MHSTYEAPQVEVVSFSLSHPIAENNTDGVVDAGNGSIVPLLS